MHVQVQLMCQAFTRDWRCPEPLTGEPIFSLISTSHRLTVWLHTDLDKSATRPEKARALFMVHILERPRGSTSKADYSLRILQRRASIACKDFYARVLEGPRLGRARKVVSLPIGTCAQSMSRIDGRVTSGGGSQKLYTVQTQTFHTADIFA